MEEQKLEIKENGQYKNIELKSKLHKGIVGLDDGNYVIVEKVFTEGYEFISERLKDANGDPLKSYSCRVLYGEENTEVSFWLNAREHKIYAELGGIGDKVKIILHKETMINPKTGTEMLINKLSFEAFE